MKSLSRLLIPAIVVLLSASSFADEGMYPLSELHRLDLRAKGLEIDPKDVYNPDGISLIDGICKVNGCTGSFVSPNGLIITNHHCAYRAINSASSAENDYLKDGFRAKSMGEEIPATGYTVRITESYKDVSREVLSVVKGEMTFAERSKAVSKRRKELEQLAEKANPGMRAEVAEMFVGKTYVLFMYTYIKDVRLVFAPPSSVGNFGGDVDNWEWPRHTGDFSFMRAYVAPDGSSAEYSKDNVPFKPKKHIPVAKRGVDEGDFVFLLGYPGRTARHKTSHFLRFEEEFRLPYIVDLYQWQIREMEKAGANDREVALKFSSRSKSLANVEKRSRGQLKGLDRKGIVSFRASEEAKLQSFIDATPELRSKYGNLLKDIDGVYSEMRSNAQLEYDFNNLKSACRSLYIAFTVIDAAVERQKPDLERVASYMDRNFGLTKQRLLRAQKDLHRPTDQVMMSGMLKRLADNLESAEIKPLAKLLAEPVKLEAQVESLFAGSRLSDPDMLEKLLSATPDELADVDDSLLQLTMELYPYYLKLREKGQEREGKLGSLYGSLIEVKQQFLKTNFVPDANATLRMTFGRVKSYSPADGIVKTPITTLTGVIEKTTGKDPFITPNKIAEMYKTRDFGKFEHPVLKDLPVAILYDTDTTGGNSGSPIINARGELVGVNFDRAFEATINDFAWNKSYSRSIGVDVRYALWITGNVYGAKDLLKEMGVD